MSSRVSMQDIADSIGVSKVTVSKALRGQSDVSEEMRDRIVKTAENLGYVYKNNLKSGNISKIIVLTSERFFGVGDSFYIKLYQHLSEELGKQEIDAILSILDSESEKNGRVPDKIRYRQADGLIVMGQLSREFLNSLKTLKIPMAFLDFYYDDFDVTSINTDNFFSTYELTEMLIKCGFSKIGFVGNIGSTSSIEDRFLGYYKALIEHRIPLEQKWMINDRDEDGRYIDLSLPEELPKAFVCNCDEVALTLINALKAHGIRVPEDVSVVGFDDSVHAVKAAPAITTVHVSLREMAHAASKAIVKRINGSSGMNNRILIKGKIVLRDSVMKTDGNR